MRSPAALRESQSGRNTVRSSMSPDSVRDPTSRQGSPLKSPKDSSFINNSMRM